MKLNTWQWIGLAVLIVCIGSYLIRECTTSSKPSGVGNGTQNPAPAVTQPATTRPATQPAR